jgi:hypothetical protein
MTASDLLLFVSGYLGIVIAIGVLHGGQEIASRQRRANASQRQIDRTISSSLALGTLLGIGAVAALVIADGRTTTVNADRIQQRAPIENGSTSVVKLA